MKHYLESHKLYAQAEETKLVYQISEFEVYSDYEAIQIYLELVAGWDYVNPDYNDIQGWVSANNFVEDVQFEIVNQYFLVEGMEEALKENGYIILKDIPQSLQKIIDKHNEV